METEEIFKLSAEDVFGKIVIKLWDNAEDEVKDSYLLSDNVKDTLRNWAIFLMPTSKDKSHTRTIDGKFQQVMETISIEDLQVSAVFFAASNRLEGRTDIAKLFFPPALQSVMNMTPTSIPSPSLVDAFQKVMDWISNTIIPTGLSAMYKYCDQYAKRPLHWESWQINANLINEVPFEMRLPLPEAQVTFLEKEHVSYIY